MVALQAFVVRTVLPAQGKAGVHLGDSVRTCYCTGSVEHAGFALRTGSFACSRMRHFAPLELVVRQALAVAAAEHAAWPYPRSAAVPARQGLGSDWSWTSESSVARKDR